MNSHARQTTSELEIDALIDARRSIRAFTSREVSNDQILDLLRVASRAPSGTNSQPWRVYVLRGASRKALVDDVCRAHDEVFSDPEKATEYSEAYDYYPSDWFEPYLARRRQNGYSLYELVGIAKGDKMRMHAQHQRNFKFFDAPVGMMFTVDRKLGQGSFLDYGMFLQNFMLAAKARGIDTCPQAAWNMFGRIILPHVDAQSDEIVLCGMAIGYADEQAPENSLRTPRAEPEVFTKIFE